MSLQLIQQYKPLVHCITNYVVANFTANGLLAIGASPIMADEIEEVSDIVSITNALLLNIGTVNQRTLSAMLLAGKQANKRNIPIVLDPVGVGASKFRKQAINTILSEVKVDAIRCNAGELAAIANIDWVHKGVDSGEGTMDIAQISHQVAAQYQCIVIVTGAVDTISNAEETIVVRGGHEVITQITGTGCLLSAICAAALATKLSPLPILRDILQQYKQIAEQIANQKGLGSIQVALLDQLSIQVKETVS